MAGLSARARKILFSAVAEYIATGDPVGSRTLARKYVVDLSPATIRNVLADLEDAGFLMQPHTSAGRVPTNVALRAFISALTEFPEIPAEQVKSMREQLEEIFGQQLASDDALRRAGQLLSGLTGAAAVVAISPASSRKLAQLRFIPTGSGRLLAVLVFADGMVENRYISVDGPVAEPLLTRIHNLLADVVEGRSLGALHELFERRLDDDRIRLDELRSKAFELGDKALGKVAAVDFSVVIEGSARLVELPDYADVDKLKRLMTALEDRQLLVGLLDKTVHAGVVSVYIGEETEELGEAQLSLVAAPYGDGDQAEGTVGVLGPTRMDYARMMPLVGATAKAMTAAIKKRKRREEPG